MKEIFCDSSLPTSKSKKQKRSHYSKLKYKYEGMFSVEKRAQRKAKNAKMIEVFKNETANLTDSDFIVERDSSGNVIRRWEKKLLISLLNAVKTKTIGRNVNAHFKNLISVAIALDTNYSEVMMKKICKKKR